MLWQKTKGANLVLATGTVFVAIATDFDISANSYGKKVVDIQNIF